MSLDVYLEGAGALRREGTGVYVRGNGRVREVGLAEWRDRFPGYEPVTFQAGDESGCCFSANVTHNLGRMANEAGIYKHLWRPDEIGVVVAADLIDPLREGLDKLESDRARFEALNPSNGWGDYDVLVRFVEEYLQACCRYPNAAVRVSR